MADDHPPSRFVPIPDVENIEALLERPGDVLLFLHDPGWSLSLLAHHELRRVGGEIAQVDVRRQRDISREVEARTGIDHESSQAILPRDGSPVWSASHGRTTADAVAEATAG